MTCLPLPRSSAGVPRNTISPGRSSAIAARAIAAPTPDAAIVLCPQPWPRPGQRVVLGEDPDPRTGSTATAAHARPDGGRAGCRPDARRRSRAPAAHRRPRPPPGAPRTRARGSRGSGGTGRRSRRERPRRPRRCAPWLGERLGGACWRGGRARILRRCWVGRSGAGPPPDGTRRAEDRAQRSAESVASATAARAMMNSAIGSSRAPCSRSTMKIATISPTHAPRRPARTQSPR